MSRYITLPQLKSYMGLGTETDADDVLQMCIDNAESGIEQYTRRNFVGTPGTVYVNRYEQDSIKGNAYWMNHDIHTLVALTLGDGQSVPVGSVWLEPREGPPYRVLRLRSSYVYTWNTDQDMIISGTWGYGTVAPADVQQATARYATFLYRQKDVTPNDQIGYDQGAGVQPVGRGMPDDVRYLLSPYRSRSGGMI
jgi:hypothetical protein